VDTKKTADGRADAVGTDDEIMGSTAAILKFYGTSACIDALTLAIMLDPFE
jgi:hypothetical protein